MEILGRLKIFNHFLFFLKTDFDVDLLNSFLQLLLCLVLSRKSLYSLYIKIHIDSLLSDAVCIIDFTLVRCMVM